ncbi:MAG TPA: glycosyltransferase [Bryobacteraceae bacterium]|nr:glycosyltransferase [Bryobacteraceae bacterium]
MGRVQDLISYHQLETLRKRVEALQSDVARLKRQAEVARRASRNGARTPVTLLRAWSRRLREGLRNSSGKIRLYCDEPHDSAQVTAGARLLIRGWALAESGIAAIELHVDNGKPIPLAYGGTRPDVQSAFPNYPNAGQSGFSFDWDSTGWRYGAHRFVLRARDTAGRHTEIERVLRLAPSTAEHLRLVCDAPAGVTELAPGSPLRIRGWALAPSGIARIECRIDEGPVHPIPHGTPRPDVQQAFPDAPNAGKSGFELELDPRGLAHGDHHLRLSAWSHAGDCEVLERAIVLKALEPDNILLHCDYPLGRGCQPVRDVVQIRGWALSWTGIREVRIEIGSGPPIAASYGVPRPDVARQHSEYLRPENSGFRFFWDTTTIPEGRYSIRITAIANSGASLALAREVIVDQECLLEYGQWIALTEPGADEKREMAARSGAFARRPKISVLVPVFRTPLDLLARCIDSVREQIYPEWELCLVDDGSDDTAVTGLMARYSALDPRIRCEYLPENRGIAAATNHALRMCTGDYIGFLDSDDELADFALWEVVRVINENPAMDLFYSDEDKLDAKGRRYEWFFKPNWSPDLFLSCNYLCHFVVFRRWILDQVQSLDESCRHGSQDYEFLLRVTEHTRRIHRIPKVLYHWRAIEGSTARTSLEKPGASLEGQAALTAYLNRNRLGATAEEVASCRYRVRYPIAGNPHVDILMPTGGNMTLLRRAVEDVLEKTTYPAYSITILDNSSASDVEQFARRMESQGAAVRYMDWRRRRFNFSAMNNEAVQRSQAPYVLFLNDDMTVITAEWLTAMLEHAQRPEIGAVGAQLWFPDNTIQHAGVILGVFGNSGHAFKTLRAGAGHYFDFPNLTRNTSAVTAACLLLSREKFWEAGGFDEEDLAVAFQDLDLCLKLLEKGYRNVYTPYARLYHYESATKTEVIPNPVEDQFIKRKWARYITDDPYYNPNLTRNDERYGIRLDWPPQRDPADSSGPVR